VRERAGGPIIALTRGGESITLEPGSQFELSGAPLATIHAICSEFHRHMDELSPISKSLGIRWMGLGFHPFAKRTDLGFVPKARYGIMREYLPTRGALALDMMLRTCTVQANFDYASERDALRKLRVGLKLSPLTTAMFANSPWYEGAAHGGLTYRGRVWLDVDPDRSGLLPSLWADGSGYREYVEWALDTPMFLFKRRDKVIANTGQTFRSFWKDGYKGHKPVLGDWTLHLNTLFPEVRLKNTIEIRGADAQGKATRCALPALWTGLYYDERALDGAEELTADWRHDEVAAVRADVAKRGVRAVFRGKPMVDLAIRVLELAEGGLARRARTRPDGKDERIHLARLRQLLEKGLTPADKLLDGMDPANDFRREVMVRADLAGS
jgi:glutamate--cysteine ligase